MPSNSVLVDDVKPVPVTVTVASLVEIELIESAPPTVTAPVAILSE